MRVWLLLLACLLGGAPAFGQPLQADAGRLATAEGLASARPAAALAALPESVVPQLRCELALLRAELLAQVRPTEALAALPGRGCTAGLRMAALELELRLAPGVPVLERWLELRGLEYARVVAQAAEGKTGLQIQKVLKQDGDVLAAAWKRLLDAGVQRAAAELYLRFPQTAEGARVRREQAGPVKEEDLYTRARILAALGRFEQAAPVLEDLAATTKNAALLERTQLELGQTYEKLRDGAACAAVLERLLRRVAPDSPTGQQARFVLARNFYRRVPSRRDEALPLLEALAAAPSTAGKVRESALQFRVGILQETSRIPQAIELLEAEGSRKDSGLREWSLEKLGWLRLRRQERSAAVEAYAALLALPATGESRAAALYWSGRALEGLGQPQKARPLYGEAAAEFPMHWYGLQALERYKIGAPAPLPAPPPPPLLDRLAAQKLPAGREAKIEALLGAKLWRFAGWELEESFEQDANSLPVLFRLAQVRAEQGDLETSTFLAGKGFGSLRYSGQGPPEILKLLYPLPYMDDLRRHAAEYQVPASLVAGLVHQESGFYAQVVSAAGAIGLMQMMPSTASATARRVGLKGFETKMLYDPAVNLRLGIYHLGELLRSFGGERAPAVASYNAGSQKVRQWWKKSDARDIARFAEGIPYSETRDYVKKVLGKAEAYRRLYPELQAPTR